MRGPICAAAMADDAMRFLLARGLRVVTAPSKGRCLVANRTFRRGELILAQDPFCSVLDDSAKLVRCDGCLRLSDDLLRCSACKTVRYCSTACQRGEWKLHKEECRIMSGRPMREKQRLHAPTLRLMVRLLVKRRLLSDAVISGTPVDAFELVEALPTHFSETSPDRLVLFAQMANLVKRLVSPLEVDIMETSKLFCRFACNAHTICDEEFRPLGTGLYPVISIINHSCSPNSVLLFDGKQAIVRALENLTESAEVTISYIELAASTPSRQKALSEQYFFDCCCPGCTRKEISEDMIQDAILEGYKCSKPDCGGASLPLSDGKRLVCLTCGSIQVEFKLRSLGLEAKKFVDEAVRANAPGNERRARELFEQVLFLQEKDWEAALTYCQMTVPAYEKAYASHSPLLGLQYFTLGKLEWYLGNSKDALEALTQAMEILSCSHSSSSKVVQELSSLLQEAKAETAFCSRQNQEALS